MRDLCQRTLHGYESCLGTCAWTQEVAHGTAQLNVVGDGVVVIQRAREGEMGGLQGVAKIDSNVGVLLLAGTKHPDFGEFVQTHSSGQFLKRYLKD